MLADIAFTLEHRREVGVFVGPSGCGKSTMLRILAGLDHDYQGRVSRPGDARIGMVFQEPRLLPWRSVEDNVRLAAPDVDAATAFGAVRRAGIERRIAAISPANCRSAWPGASRWRARFAVEPDFLILDEPLASLDEALAARLRDQIATAGRKAAPMMTLLVTHNLDDAVRLGDRLFLLSARPASILHAVPIATPRSARSEADIAGIKDEIARLHHADRLSHIGTWLG